ncbi:hypothetical protein L596_017182 [Steinernema carpocapsae]|uniref:Uncharacterized protein n=1 Tax=Steinernema carpocapsae TaxID=34508 RepID=A0A4V6XW30_STECR|nr:hypothetical protein L596_017182 [Steinernema carpocapsae]
MNKSHSKKPASILESSLWHVPLWNSLGLIGTPSYCSFGCLQILHMSNSFQLAGASGYKIFNCQTVNKIGIV